MQLEVSDEEMRRLRDVGDMQGQVGVREEGLAVILGVHHVGHWCTLGRRVVVVKGVCSFRFGELVVDVVQKVERVHVVELGRVILIEDLLLI